MKHVYSILFLVLFSVFSSQANDLQFGAGADFAPAQERKIVVIVPSYNNAHYVVQNLDSIFSQEYSNYRIIYIDDCSTDGTFELVKKYVSERNLWSNFKLIHNTTRRGALANLYHAIKSCKDYEIVATVDGDDWAATPQMLSRVNAAYADPQVWLTYGQFQFYPQGTPGYCSEIPRDVTSSIRRNSGAATHLRTFYAGLFKKIAKNDLMYNGAFYAVTWDKAMMAPMLEMANGKWQFIQDILYTYNNCNPISDAALHGAEQVRMRDHIIELPAYEPLHAELPFERARADMVIFSYDRPLQLYALLESIEKYISGLGHIVVIYRNSNEQFGRAYQQVFNRFASVQFLNQSPDAQADFKTLTIHATFATPSPYIIYAVDDIIVKDFVDMSECIRLLEKNNAYGFYLRLGKNLTECYAMGDRSQRVPECRKVKHNVYEWRFCGGQYDWNYPNTVDMTLYRKKDIESYVRHLNYTTPNTFEGEWAGRGAQVTNRTGLFYRASKVVNVPLNCVGEFGNKHMNFMQPAEMLNLFEQGKKIDIKPLYKIHNKGAHTAYVPTFINR